MRDQFISRLCELAVEDPRIVLITGDLGFRVLDDYRERFPDRFVNAGVAEQNMTALATGMALEGHVVFTYSIANFPTLRCLEQIRNDACYHGADVKIVAVGGGFSYGALGISHHATEDLAILRSLPDMRVVSPGGYWETREATAAIAATPGACYLRLDKSAGDDSPRPGEGFRFGAARVLRDGGDCTIFVTGGILGEVQAAADELARDGVEARVVSIHSVKPLDAEAVVRCASETRHVFTVEEHTIDGGLGSAIAETLLDNGCHPETFVRLGLRSRFSSIVGSQDYLRRRYGLDARTIAARVEDVLDMVS